MPVTNTALFHAMYVSVKIAAFTVMLFSDNDVLNVVCMLGQLCVFQGWCVKSSDPCTLNIHSVPKEVIPGQVNALGSFVSISHSK